MVELGFTRSDLEYAPVKANIKAGKTVVRKALEEYGSEDMVIGFTGGKDSTLTAWIVKQVCEEQGFSKPRFLFIDHGQHFQSILGYVDKISSEWGFEVDKVENTDLISQVESEGDTVKLEDLNKDNREQVRRVDKELDEVPFKLDTKVGNHLLKTVPMNNYIEENGVKAVVNGVRWDEHESRSSEDWFSPRDNPEHMRVHPILQFTELNVWQATWQYMVPDTVQGINSMESMPETVDNLPNKVEVQELPINSKYWGGYRSLGSESETGKTSEKPAWTQDLENTSEREGRAQNKDSDQIMSSLRSLGYMMVFTGL